MMHSTVVFLAMAVSASPVEAFTHAANPSGVRTWRQKLALGGPSADGNDLPPDDALYAELKRRIESLAAAEALSSEAFEDGLRRRARAVAAADEAEASLPSGGGGRVRLPVVALAAPLLPRQRLSGTTDDQNFARFLRDLGLGGLFVATSVNRKLRKVRRSGVVARVELVDADGAGAVAGAGGGGGGGGMAGPPAVPTAVRFAVAGRRRCRVVGPARDMVARVGRWRRSYDPDGEESTLGWGEERFTDSVFGGAVLAEAGDGGGTLQQARYADWPTNEVCLLDGDDDGGGDAPTRDEIVTRAESLVPLLGRWLSLASDPATYNNADVVASACLRRRGEPGLSVDPSRLLRTVLADLGERPPPTRPTALAFWGAALINPLPPLGVSPEIRGAVLEAANADRRLAALERGLVRSIQNLDGTLPLFQY